MVRVSELFIVEETDDHFICEIFRKGGYAGLVKLEKVKESGEDSEGGFRNE